MAIAIDVAKASKLSPKVIDYGTSGFRSRAEDLDHVVYRTGLLSVLRSKKKKGETVGLMITASHNPDCDNGVKLIDPDGEMLEHEWEILASNLINAKDDEVESLVRRIAATADIDMSIQGCVYIGRDTRSSSPKLAQLAMDGIAAMNGCCTDFGVVTTPVLHFLVFSKNKIPVGCIGRSGDVPSEDDYNAKLITPFRMLNDNLNVSNYSRDLIVDCSNGVGAAKVKELKAALENCLSMRVYNDGRGVLNDKCGADYVKVSQRAPHGIPLEKNARCVSLDGDADRLIYFYVDDDGRCRILDGDRIATLIAGHIMELTRRTGADIHVGLVQTAYANGNSTRYITNTLRVPVACVPTGVKHLHHKAKEFDVGVYFEANGHGTVVFSPRAEAAIRTAAKTEVEEERRAAALRLVNLMELTNQTVGDAVSDMLIVETILAAKDWSIADWEKCYDDLPNRLTKVTIQDRNTIQTANAERVCVSPSGLQEEIDKLAAKFRNGRSFVRASGTEDVVRVYAEAETQEAADELARSVAAAVHKMAGGVGPAPEC